MIRAFIYGLFGLLGLVSPVFAGELVEGIPNYVNEGVLLKTITCDSGMTKYNRYDVGDRGKGVTIVIDKKARYYIFSPNPYSMSPITLTFVVNADGYMEEISRQKRNTNLEIETPNLYALLVKKEKNDCTHKIFKN